MILKVAGLRPIPPAVIPAKAGIQWFIKSIPARAGMTNVNDVRNENNIEGCRAASIPSAVIPAKAGIQWFMQYIPARAGMTM